MHAGKGRKSSMKKTTLPSEGAYIAAMALISLAVAMVAASNFGVSMIVGPAYILSLRFPALSFGQWEYVIQGGLFAAMCLILRRVRPVFLSVLPDIRGGAGRLAAVARSEPRRHHARLSAHAPPNRILRLRHGAHGAGRGPVFQSVSVSPGV